MILATIGLILAVQEPGPDFQKVFQAHSEAITDLVFSPDGKKIATSSMDLTVGIWDAQTGKKLGVLPAGEENPDNGAVCNQFYVRGLRFFPDSRRVATFGPTAKIWDIVERKERFALIAHDSASCLAITPDGKTVAKGGWGITLWDGQTGARIRSLEAEACPAIDTLSFSADGKILLSSGWKNNEKVNRAHLMVWSVETGEALLDLGKGRTRVNHAALSADGKMVLATLQNPDNETSRLVAWELPSGVQKYSFDFKVYKIDEMVLSPDSRSVVTKTWGGSVRLWDLAGGRERPVNLPALHAAECIAFSPDGTLLGIAEGRWVDKEIVPFLSIHDPLTGRKIASRRVGLQPIKESWSHLKSVTVTFSPDGKRMALALANGEVSLVTLSEFLRSK
jgi:WD40 repeat protein